MASVSTVATLYSLGASVLAVGLMVLLHVLEPEFDPSWRMLSEYSLGRYGVLMRVAFLAMGTRVIAVAVVLWRVAEPWSLGLVLVSIGPLGAALVDTDPITTPRAQMSCGQWQHRARHVRSTDWPALRSDLSCATPRARRGSGELFCDAMTRRRITI